VIPSLVEHIGRFHGLASRLQITGAAKIRTLASSIRGVIGLRLAQRMEVTGEGNPVAAGRAAIDIARLLQTQIAEGNVGVSHKWARSARGGGGATPTAWSVHAQGATTVVMSAAPATPIAHRSPLQRRQQSDAAASGGQDQYRKPRLDAAARGECIAKRLCFFCRRPGHRIEECPSRPPGVQQQPQQPPQQQESRRDTAASSSVSRPDVTDAVDAVTSDKPVLRRSARLTAQQQVRQEGVSLRRQNYCIVAKPEKGIRNTVSQRKEQQ